mgnify:CR=1 FL=1
MTPEPILFLASASFCSAVLFKIFRNAGTSRQAFAGIIIWLLFSGFLAISGILSDFQSLPPRMGLIIFPGILALVFAAKSKKIIPIIQATPQSLLIYAQSFRIVVEIVLFMLVSNGAIPKIMSWEGRNFDILIGLSAPIIGYLYCQKKAMSDTMLKAWNYLGIGLLINVVAHGLLSAPTPFQVFDTSPANTFIASWPYVWLPALLVPTAFFLHIISIRKLNLHK